MHKGYETRFYVGLIDRDGKPVQPEVYLDVMNNRHLAGFTCFEVTGYWHGQQEKSLVFEVIRAEYRTEFDAKHYEDTSAILREVGNQESILMTVKEVKDELYYDSSSAKYVTG